MINTFIPICGIHGFGSMSRSSAWYFSFRSFCQMIAGKSLTTRLRCFPALRDQSSARLRSSFSLSSSVTLARNATELPVIRALVYPSSFMLNSM